MLFSLNIRPLACFSSGIANASEHQSMEVMRRSGPISQPQQDSGEQRQDEGHLDRSKIGLDHSEHCGQVADAALRWLTASEGD